MQLDCGGGERSAYRALFWRSFLTFAGAIRRMKGQLAQMEERPGSRAPKGQASLACAGLRRNSQVKGLHLAVPLESRETPKGQTACGR